MTIAAIAVALGTYRLVAGREADYQTNVAAVLHRAALPFDREFDLGGGYGRVDFFVPSLGLGIELKVKGSPSAVTEQLHRYARCGQIQALMLVTGSVRLGRLPATLCGKPLTIVSTWRGGL